MIEHPLCGGACPLSQSQALFPPQVLPPAPLPLCPMKPQIHSGTSLDLRLPRAELPRPLDLKKHVPLPIYRRSAEAVPAPRLFLWTPKAAGLLAQQMLSSGEGGGREEGARHQEGPRTTRPCLQLAPRLWLRERPELQDHTTRPSSTSRWEWGGSRPGSESYC